LLELAALSRTLICDEDGVYDPAHFNDRLLLGLKGTMSEAELHVLKSRLQGGILNKARRGELEIRPRSAGAALPQVAVRHLRPHRLGQRDGQGCASGAFGISAPLRQGRAQG
jgi:DNA invertase Pin-like site-specific DNA recombinase